MKWLLIHEEMIDIIKRNRVFREGTIGRYIVAGLDCVELFSNTKKSGSNCLTRKKLTGGKRLIDRLKKRHGNFADVVVANAFFVYTISSVML